MRLNLEATPTEIEEKGEELIRALMETVSPFSLELAENLEKALPEKQPNLKYKALREIHARTKDEYRKMLGRMTEAIGKVLTKAGGEPVFTKSEAWTVCDLEKAEQDWLDDFGTDWLEKGAGHKYLRRWKGPDGKWRYEYNVLATGTVRQYQVGDKVAVKHQGKEGHFEIVATRTSPEGKRQVQVKHDETGHTAWVSELVLAELFRQQHDVATEAGRASSRISAAIMGYDPTKGPGVRVAAATKEYAKILLKRQEEIKRLFDPYNRYHRIIDYAAQQELHGWYQAEFKAAIDEMKPLIADYNKQRQAKIDEGYWPSSEEVYGVRKKWREENKAEIERVTRALREFLTDIRWKMEGDVQEQKEGSKHEDWEVSMRMNTAWHKVQAFQKQAELAKLIFDDLTSQANPDTWARTAKGKLTKAFKALEIATYEVNAALESKREFNERSMGVEKNPVTETHSSKGVKYLLQLKNATADQKATVGRALQSMESAVEQVRKVFPGAVERDLTVWVDYTPEVMRRKHTAAGGNREFHAAGYYMPYETGLFTLPGREREKMGKGEVTIFTTGFRDRMPSDVMVHELGHRFYYQTMTPAERDEWRALVKERTTTPTKEDVDKLWDAIEYKDETQFYGNSEEFDQPRLLEELNRLGPLGRTVAGSIKQTYFSYKNATVQRQYVRELLDELVGHPIVDPYVTMYGGTNESEYFAEAFMHYVQGGPRNLPEWTRAIFERLTSQHRLKKSEDEADLEKAGPFIGPRGGKWADAAHTIPWKESEHGSKRTGLVPVPDAQVHEVGNAIMANLRANKHGQIRSAEGAHTKTEIRMADGRVLPANVYLHMDPEVKDPRGVAGSARVARTVVNGQPSIHSVDIHVRYRHSPGNDMDDVGPKIRSVLAHEMTHVADPSLHAQQDKDAREVYARGMQAAQKEGKDYKSYVNEKAEVTARLQQIARDIMDTKAVAEIRNAYESWKADPEMPPPYHPTDVARWSPTWEAIEEHLTPENRKRVLKAVAQIVDGIQAGRLEAVKKALEADGDLVKAGGPYIGPRGGKWADPEHTIPWQESGGEGGGGESAPSEIAEGHTFDLHVHPKIAQRDDAKDTWRVVAQDGDKVKLSRHEGSEYGPWMPKASVKHFANDLAGKVEAPPSGNPDVDAVTSGKAEFLGKGDDGLAFKVGDKVVKVSTTVPYQPENPGHRSPEQAVDMLRRQVEVGNKLADLGVPGIQRSEFVQAGDKGFQVKPWVEIPEKFTREQLTAIQDSLIAMHKAGYSLNDAVQAGLDADGKPVLFDVGKAAPSTGAGYNSSIESDFDRLKMLYQDSGETFVRRDFSEGQQAWERYQQQAAKFAASDPPNFGHNVLMRAVTKLVAEAKDSLKGKELKDRLAKIQEQYEDELAMLGGEEKLTGKERERVLKPEAFKAPEEPAKEAPKPAFALESGEAPKAKTRTPVKSKKAEANAPLPGQMGMFGTKDVAKQPVQQNLFGPGPVVLPPSKAQPEEKPPEVLPGQMGLFRSMDHTQAIAEKEGVAYRRVKQAMRQRGYNEADFEPGGQFFGQSVNELLDTLRATKSLESTLRTALE